MAFVNYNAWAEVVCTPLNCVYKIPDEMTFPEAAAFSVNFVAAYMMLFEVANLRDGMSVLVHSAGGGVVSLRLSEGGRAGRERERERERARGGEADRDIKSACLGNDITDVLLRYQQWNI